MSILIVDDSKAIRKQLEVFLKSGGYPDLLFAESAQEAFHLLGIGDCGLQNEKTEMCNAQSEIQDPKSKVDLILMDIEMPEIDGIEACRRIKENHQVRNIPIIMVTGKTAAEDLQMAFETGSVDYITKPLNKVELHARVKSVLKLKYEMDQRKARERDLLKTTGELNLTLQELKKRNTQMENDLNIAHKMQLGIVPQKDRMELLSKEYLLRISSFFKPSNKLGGDFWDIIELKGEKTGIILIDFAGHGIAPSLNTFRIKEFIHSLADKINSPEVLMGLINDNIFKNYNMHATCVYAVYDKREKKLEYCRAGHPYAIWYKKNEDKITELNTKGMALGFLPAIKYEKMEILLEPGDKLVFYTDGIIEARNKKEELFGTHRLIEIIGQNKNSSSSNLSKSIVKCLSDFTGEVELDDDVTLVTMEQQIS